MQCEQIQAQLALCLDQTNPQNLGTCRQGKVRDIYERKDHLIIVTTDRVSAFDRVLTTIPFKGEILNAMAVFGFKASEDVFPNHLIEVPDPNVMLVKKCTPLPIEFVMRAYITGSLWRDYEAGRTDVYGIELPKGLKRDQKFEQPILTPTTKAEVGQHDEAISPAEIIKQGLLSASVFAAAESAARALFQRGAELAAQRGLILVDTKYEFGIDNTGTLRVIDEIHTPDSSRYWLAKEYLARFSAGQEQAMLDKENLRGWLLKEHNFKGDGPIPPIPDAVRIDLSESYMRAYECLLNKAFQGSLGDVKKRVHTCLAGI